MKKTQEHVFSCIQLTKNIRTFGKIFENKSDNKYMKEITKEFNKNMKDRRIILDGQKLLV